jgi:hypothetical protein
LVEPADLSPGQEHKKTDTADTEFAKCPIKGRKRSGTWLEFWLVALPR